MLFCLCSLGKQQDWLRPLVDGPSWITWKFGPADLNQRKGKTAFSCSWIYSVVVQAGALWDLFDHGSHMAEGTSSPTCGPQSLTATRNKLSYLGNLVSATCDWRGMRFLKWDKKVCVQPWTDLADRQGFLWVFWRGWALNQEPTIFPHCATLDYKTSFLFSPNLCLWNLPVSSGGQLNLTFVW